MAGIRTDDGVRNDRRRSSFGHSVTIIIITVQDPDMRWPPCHLIIAISNAATRFNSFQQH